MTALLVVVLALSLAAALCVVVYVSRRGGRASRWPRATRCTCGADGSLELHRPGRPPVRLEELPPPQWGPWHDTASQFRPPRTPK